MRFKSSFALQLQHEAKILRKNILKMKEEKSQTVSQHIFKTRKKTIKYLEHLDNNLPIGSGITLDMK